MSGGTVEETDNLAGIGDRPSRDNPQVSVLGQSHQAWEPTSAVNCPVPGKMGAVPTSWE